MKYRQVGASPLIVSEIALGSWLTFTSGAQKDNAVACSAMNGFLNRDWLRPRVLEAVQALRPLAAEAGLTLTKFALAWVLRQSNVASAITGASRPEQVEENAAASGRTVAPELFERAERIIAAAATPELEAGILRAPPRAQRSLT